MHVMLVLQPDGDASAPSRAMTGAVVASLGRLGHRVSFADHVSRVQAEQDTGPVDAVIVEGVALLAQSRAALAGRHVIVLHSGARPAPAEEGNWLARTFRRQDHARPSSLELADHVLLPFGIVAAEDAVDRTGFIAPVPTPMPQTGGAQRTIGFDVGLVGDWTRPQASEGLEWFLRAVLPDLDDGIGVAIAGPTPRGMAARNSRVLFLGPVMDDHAFCRQCRIIAWPHATSAERDLTLIGCLGDGVAAVVRASPVIGMATAPGHLAIMPQAEAFGRALADWVTAHRAGAAEDGNGQAFLASQNEATDRAVRHALSAHKKPRPMVHN